MFTILKIKNIVINKKKKKITMKENICQKYLKNILFSLKEYFLNYSQ